MRPFLTQLRKDPSVTIVAISAKLYWQGWDLYVARADKGWSLTDCISFVVMEEKGIREALATDGDFEQAGFQLLLSR